MPRVCKRANICLDFGILQSCFLSHTYKLSSTPFWWGHHHWLNTKSTSFKYIKQDVVHDSLLHRKFVLNIHLVQHIIDHFLNQVVRHDLLVDFKHHSEENPLAPFLLKWSQYSIRQLVSHILPVPVERVRFRLEFGWVYLRSANDIQVFLLISGRSHTLRCDNR